jgi:hypothetical protein
VVDFRTRKLSTAERKCTLSCTDKWMQAQQRMTRVFAEEQIAMMKEMEEQQAKKMQ